MDWIESDLTSLIGVVADGDVDGSNEIDSV